MGTKPTMTETQRIEKLWAEGFGDAYSERNKDAGAGREKFWSSVLHAYPAKRILEVGCNVGLNLQCIAAHVPQEDLYGIDVNRAALHLLHERLPEVRALLGTGRELPFRDAFFDIVFTAGVLIHQPEEALREVMAEVVRCSRRFVLCMEYFAEQTTEVPYRGQSGALFKRNYGRLYQDYFPELTLRAQEFLPRGDGWDDVTFWMFEKSAADSLLIERK
jgi:pseudaminic acid biosynthesis-associated methylase